MRYTTSLKLGLGGVLLAGVTLGVSGIAAADYEPSSTDVVAVTGDTPQFALQFLSDGDYNGDAGFNSSGSYNKLVSFNATADGNARSAYAQGSTQSSPIALNPTDVLRAGTFPVQRVQSSGAALTALLNDTGAQETINFIGSSTLPTSAQQNQASTNGWGYLHVVQLGTDAVQIATASVTNAPAGLSAAELVKIYNGTYTTWGQIPGYTGPAPSDTIIPEIPPSSSAIYKTLTADLKSANGGTAVSLGSDVKTVEQNDPTAITGATTPADAIVPFSQARFNLWTDGYFHNPATAFPGSSTALSSGIKLLSGATPDSGTVYSSPIADYVIFRQSDLASTTAFEPGGTKNWVQTLFSSASGTPLVKSAIGQSLIAASGVTPSYQDLGDVSAG
jgi:ABC-type phosphate transport system substrate-binding protein